MDNMVTAQRIQDALKKAGGNFDGVQVTGTREGVVIEGKVPSAADRTRALEIVKAIHRPAKLTDRLRVAK